MEGLGESGSDVRHHRGVAVGVAGRDRGIDVADRTDRLGGAHQAHHRAAELGQLLLDEPGVAQQVAHHRACADAAEAAQAMAHVGEEALARLLAVSGDVDPGVTLVLDDPARGIGHHLLELERVHRLAAALADEGFGERVRAW